MAASAHRARVKAGMAGLSKKEVAFRLQEGLPVPFGVRKKAGGSQNDQPVIVRDYKPIFAAFKRTGKLPKIVDGDKAAQIENLYQEGLKLASKGLFSKKLIISFKRQLLLREGIEPNPGPCKN